MINGDYINYWLGSPKAHKYGKNVTITKQDILWGNLTFTSRKADKATMHIFEHPFLYTKCELFLSVLDKHKFDDS